MEGISKGRSHILHLYSADYELTQRTTHPLTALQNTSNKCTNRSSQGSLVNYIVHVYIFIKLNVSPLSPFSSFNHKIFNGNAK